MVVPNTPQIEELKKAISHALTHHVTLQASLEVDYEDIRISPEIMVFLDDIGLEALRLHYDLSRDNTNNTIDSPRHFLGFLGDGTLVEANQRIMDMGFDEHIAAHILALFLATESELAAAELLSPSTAADPRLGGISRHIAGESQALYSAFMDNALPAPAHDYLPDPSDADKITVGGGAIAMNLASHEDFFDDHDDDNDPGVEIAQHVLELALAPMFNVYDKHVVTALSAYLDNN